MGSEMCIRDSVLADELAERADVTELVVSEHDILDGIARGAAPGRGRGRGTGA